MDENCWRKAVRHHCCQAGARQETPCRNGTAYSVLPLIYTAHVCLTALTRFYSVLNAVLTFQKQSNWMHESMWFACPTCFF